MSQSTPMRHRLAPIVGLTTFFGVWEFAVRLFHVGEYKLIKPSAALREVYRSREFFLAEARPTALVALAGFVLAGLVAFVVGAAISQSVTAERAVFPVALIVVVTPLFAYAQAVLIWIGFGFRSLVVMVAIVCFPPLLFNMVAGLRSADPFAEEVFDSVAASRWEKFRKLQLPGSLLHVLAGAKVSSGLALVGVTIGEPYAFVDHGLGLAIRRAASAGNTALPQLWGAIFVLGFLGAVAYLVLSGMETAARRWLSLDT